MRPLPPFGQRWTMFWRCRTVDAGITWYRILNLRFIRTSRTIMSALRSYRAGLHCITLGPWLAKLLRERYQATTDYFDFAVDTKVYYPRPVTRDSRLRVCFYARPATPRRAYELGLEALRLTKEQVPEVEICFFGATNLEPEPPFAFTDRGVLRHEELATLFCALGRWCCFLAD